MTANLPVVGGDLNDWGTVLNQYLQVGHNADGGNRNTLSAFNAKDDAYGAKGDGVQNDYTAIMAAYAAIPSIGGDLYLPPGTYNCGTALAFTDAKPVRIIGSRATIRFTFASGDGLTINGPSVVEVRDVTFSSSVTRSATSYYLKVVGAATCRISNVIAATNDTGAGLYLSGCNSPRIESCRFTSTAAAGTQLRLDASGGAAIVNSFFGLGAAEGAAPPVYVTGSATSNTFTNCHFGGGGPVTNVSVTGIVSDASTFTVTTGSAHGFQPTDLVVIRGASVAGYNNQWRIQSVASTTFVVASTLNPGVASGGTAESITACFVVDTSVASVNESMIANCIFESGGGPSYGSAGLVFNGRAQVEGAGNVVMQGWTITGCYFDYGQTGLVLASQDVNGSHQSSLLGFTIGDCVFASKMRAIHLDRPRGVFIDNCSLNWPFGYSADGVSATCGIYIYAGPAGKAQATGITIRGCNPGWPRDFGQSGASFATYGVILDGAGINDLIIEDNYIGGSTSAFGMLNTPVVAAQRWTIRNNSLASGTFPVDNTTFLPSVASASTIDLTTIVHETVKITGTTAISTISGGWIGRRVTLLFASGLALITGGNLSPSAARAVQAGERIDVTFDGTSWYVPTGTLDRTQLAQTAAGIISENASIFAISGTAAPATQQVAASLVGLRAGDVVTGVLLRNTVAAAGTLPTTARFGLADSTGKILVLSANLNALASWGQGALQFAFTAPYTILADGGYYPVFVVNGTWGTTQPTPRALNPTQFASNALSGKVALAFQQTGQTDLPGIGSSLTPATTGVVYYMGVY